MRKNNWSRVELMLALALMATCIFPTAAACSEEGEKSSRGAGDHSEMPAEMLKGSYLKVEANGALKDVTVKDLKDRYPKAVANGVLKNYSAALSGYDVVMLHTKDGDLHLAVEKAHHELVDKLHGKSVTVAGSLQKDQKNDWFVLTVSELKPAETKK